MSPVKAICNHSRLIRTTPKQIIALTNDFLSEVACIEKILSPSYFELFFASG
jgi:hypothetical protein